MPTYQQRAEAMYGPGYQATGASNQNALNALAFKKKYGHSASSPLNNQNALAGGGMSGGQIGPGSTSYAAGQAAGSSMGGSPTQQWTQPAQPSQPAGLAGGGSGYGHAGGVPGTIGGYGGYQGGGGMFGGGQIDAGSVLGWGEGNAYTGGAPSGWGEGNAQGGGGVDSMVVPRGAIGGSPNNPIYGPGGPGTDRGGNPLPEYGQFMPGGFSPSDQARTVAQGRPFTDWSSQGEYRSPPGRTWTPERAAYHQSAQRPIDEAARQERFDQHMQGPQAQQFMNDWRSMRQPISQPQPVLGGSNAPIAPAWRTNSDGTREQYTPGQASGMDPWQVRQLQNRPVYAQGQNAMRGGAWNWGG